jgi:hypothetical protein
MQVVPASCLLLLLFAVLVLTGLKESATIAFAIFVIHMLTM